MACLGISEQGYFTEHLFKLTQRHVTDKPVGKPMPALD